MWPRAYTVRPQVYIRTVLPRAGREGLFGPGQGVVETHRHDRSGIGHGEVCDRCGRRWTSTRISQRAVLGAELRRRTGSRRPRRRLGRLLERSASSGDVLAREQPTWPSTCAARSLQQRRRHALAGELEREVELGGRGHVSRDSTAKGDRRARAPGRSRRRSGPAARRATRTPARRAAAARTRRAPSRHTGRGRN